MLPLVCIDVDGTLIGPSGTPTEVVWAAADAAVARGQHLALSTARAAIGPTADYARRLDPDGWHVFHGGGALVHTGSDAVREQPLGAVAVSCALDASAANDWTLEFYGARDYAVNRRNDLALAHADLMGVPLREGDAGSISSDIVRVQFVVTSDEIEAVLGAVGHVASVSPATSPVMPGVAFISMTRPGVSKAGAIATIAAELGASLADVMVVGDGHNDLGAMRAVGHGVAMGNAEPEVKAAARHHVGPVTADGLAEALELSSRLQETAVSRPSPPSAAR